MYKLSNVRLPIDYDKEKLGDIVAQKLNTSSADILDLKLIKLSLDARKKDDIHYVASFSFESLRKLDIKKFKNLNIHNPVVKKNYKWTADKKNIIIVGSGPSGLFCALEFINVGHNVIILERGYSMEKRKIAVDNLMQNGILDTKSNIQFGEGGAGTFSDGKLNTGTKSEHIMTVLETFHKFGAKENILYDAKPHIGTDILSDVIVNIRKYIIESGSQVYFEHKLVGVLTENNSVVGVKVDTPEGEIEMPCDILIMGIGHSSRDTIRTLYDTGLKIIQKPFSMGFRIEHLQKDIDYSQYGEESLRGVLPPADYHLAIHLDSGRVVYTFCMCPGGVVVPAMSEENTIVTNGMSYSLRDGINANSALLVTINPKDFPSSHPLSGIEMQEKYEKYAYHKTNSYNAVIQKVCDFLEGKPSETLGNVKPTYTPGFELGSVEDELPDFIIDSIKEALPKLNNILRNFASNDAILTGIESRSSSPYQVPRDADMQSNIDGLYMIGEGAGYAGGIMTSAVDGIKVALKIIEKYGK